MDKHLFFRNKMELFPFMNLSLTMLTLETPRTVLVVEDEAIIRMCLVGILEDAGYRVAEASNSVEALTALAVDPEISILLTDVQMPGRMDGLDLVTQVQRDRPLIRSIVVSGNTSSQDAIKAGAVRYISKPYLANVIVGAVFEALQAA